MSNSNALHWQKFGGFKKHFDVALSSHIIQAIKPDAVCFDIALKHCGVSAQETIFFDDAVVNVEAARAVGIKAFYVCDFEDLSIQVKNLGLLAQDA